MPDFLLLGHEDQDSNLIPGVEVRVELMVCIKAVRTVLGKDEVLHRRLLFSLLSVLSVVKFCSEKVPIRLVTCRSCICLLATKHGERKGDSFRIHTENFLQCFLYLGVFLPLTLNGFPLVLIRLNMRS